MYIKIYIRLRIIEFEHSRTKTMFERSVAFQFPNLVNCKQSRIKSFKIKAQVKTVYLYHGTFEKINPGSYSRFPSRCNSRNTGRSSPSSPSRPCSRQSHSCVKIEQDTNNQNSQVQEFLFFTILIKNRLKPLVSAKNLHLNFLNFLASNYLWFRSCYM